MWSVHMDEFEIWDSEMQEYDYYYYGELAELINE